MQMAQGAARAAIAVVVLALVAAVAARAAAERAATKPTTRTEAFDRDPGWDGHNNRQAPKNPPLVIQNFGYSATNHAGKARGEIGGEFGAGLRPAWYGKSISPKSFEDQLSASGSLCVLKGQSIAGWHTSTNVYVGWFNDAPGDQIWRPVNFVGFRLQTSNEPDGCLIEVTYGTGAYQAGGAFVNAAGGAQEKNVRELKSSDLLRVPPDGSKHNWSVAYDPSGAGGAGEVVFTFDGNETRLKLADGHRKAGAKFNRFGVFTPRIPGKELVAYFDDLTIDGQAEDFARDPGWNGSGNHQRYREPAQYAYNDFGFSPTNYAGGKGKGEIGGRLYSCNPSEDPFKASYGGRTGKLTLNDHLVARGKFAAKEFSIDSTFSLGWFNSKGQGWPLHNFVGVYFDSYSKTGRLFQPMYGTSEGTKERIGQQANFRPDGTQYDWTLEYDPAGAGGRGEIRFTMGDQTVTAALQPGDKERGATFDRFGLCNMQWANSKWCEVYFDDMSYTVER